MKSSTSQLGLVVLGFVSVRLSKAPLLCTFHHTVNRNRGSSSSVVSQLVTFHKAFVKEQTLKEKMCLE